MTRGTFVLITNDRVLTSIQFNGDMYFWEPGHGDDAMMVLRNIRTPEDFDVAIREFNKMHHNYDLDENNVIESVLKLDGNEIDITENKWIRWTDYIFCKNASDKEIILHCETEDVSMKPYCSMALCFGKPDYRNIPEKLEKLSGAGGNKRGFLSPKHEVDSEDWLQTSFHYPKGPSDVSRKTSFPSCSLCRSILDAYY